jgi:hypothetical protein
MSSESNTVMLIEKLEKIELQLKKQNSFIQTFYKAVIAGIGTAIGVTIMGGIVISILNSVITSVNDIPIINKIIEIPIK